MEQDSGVILQDSASDSMIAGLAETDRGQRLSNRLPGRLRFWARRYSDWNWSWRTDMALRHVPVVSALRNAGYMQPGRPVRILDVGCGSHGGLTSYAPLRTIGIDLYFNVGRIRRHPQVTPVLGSGLALPVANASFDAVVCLDTLEHLDSEAREALVTELFRVVRDDGLVIAGAPCGAAARSAEERVNAAYRGRTGQDHPWLIEHLSNELLTPEMIRDLMAETASHRYIHYELELVPNTNLVLWELLQRERWLSHLHRLVYRPLWPLIRDCHEPPVYRHICLVRGLGPEHGKR
jgi:SAM-dependent methyltransferase